MKTSGLLYSSKNNKHASNQFLGKGELRKIFPDDHEVVLTINYLIKRKRIGNRNIGKYITKANYPKTKTKTKIIWLR